MEDKVPQFEQGPQVYVRNTFLDFDDPSLAPPPLARVRTVPASFGRPEPGEAPEDGEEPEDDEEEAAPEADREEEVNTGDEAEETQPGLKMERCVTKEWYEPMTDWDWASAQTPAQSPTSQISPETLMPTMSPTTAPTMGAVATPVMFPAPTGAAPTGGYQGPAVPLAPGMTTVMMPMLVPVGPGAPGMPVMDTGAMAASPMAHPGGASPVSPNRSEGSSSNNIWPPPPPQLAPTIERVASGSMAPPMCSPGNVMLGKMRDQMQAFADPDDGAGASAATAGPTATAEPEPSPVAKSPTSSAPQPQTLMRAYSISSGYFRVHWTVDARKLKGNDKQAVSPAFELSFGSKNEVFKMMIYPKATNDNKGGASFKKAKGKGYVQLKCEAEIAEGLASIRFRLGIGEGASAQGPRGPQMHNFSQSAVCGLPKDQEEWNFEEVIDKDSQTFRVTLEIVPAAGCC